MDPGDSAAYNLNVVSQICETIFKTAGEVPELFFLGFCITNIRKSGYFFVSL